MKFKTFTSAVLLTVSSVLVIPSASAMIDRDNHKAITVNYADLNLANNQGVEVLYNRLKSAARKACGSRDTRVRDLRENKKACFNTALNEAVAQIDNQQLTAIHTQ